MLNIAVQRQEFPPTPGNVLITDRLAPRDVHPAEHLQLPVAVHPRYQLGIAQLKVVLEEGRAMPPSMLKMALTPCG
ncbi:MAG: hypothetical protein EPO28_06235 [Saprospiraceae bacterium]|nr:MAG: hypothetical protein EPO28_06235 [Saprospiraceae bacterium]